MTHLDQDILKPHLARMAAGLRVATVGKVVSFARDTARAVVSRLVGVVDTAGQQRAYPDAPAARVVTPRGDGYGVHFDVGASDVGVLLAADSPWDQSWSTGAPSIPATGARHEYASAAFLPGGRLEIEGPKNAARTMLVGAEDGSASIEFTRTRAVPPTLGAVVVSAAGPAASVKLGSSAAALTLAYQGTTQGVLAAFSALQAADQAFWAAYPDPIVSAYYTSPARVALVTALSTALGLNVGTTKTVAE